MFEAQDASDIVSKAAGDGVNIIFGTSINANLGDVVVCATGIDSKAEEEASKQPMRRPSRPTRQEVVNPEPVKKEETETTPSPMEASEVKVENTVSKETSTPVTPEVNAEKKESQDTLLDPTSVWKQDRKENKSVHNLENEEKDDDEFDSFSSDDSNISQIETSADDESDNDIPFFKHRRQD